MAILHITLALVGWIVASGKFARTRTRMNLNLSVVGYSIRAPGPFSAIYYTTGTQSFDTSLIHVHGDASGKVGMDKSDKQVLKILVAGPIAFLGLFKQE